MLSIQFTTRAKQHKISRLPKVHGKVQITNLVTCGKEKKIFCISMKPAFSNQFVPTTTTTFFNIKFILFLNCVNLVNTLYTCICLVYVACTSLIKFSTINVLYVAHERGDASTIKKEFLYGNMLINSYNDIC